MKCVKFLFLARWFFGKDIGALVSDARDMPRRKVYATNIYCARSRISIQREKHIYTTSTTFDKSKNNVQVRRTRTVRDSTNFYHRKETIKKYMKYKKLSNWLSSQNYG